MSHMNNFTMGYFNASNVTTYNMTAINHTDDLFVHDYGLFENVTSDGQ